MRILQVRFKNLNSLAGEWLIDFSHPNYSADGIFAITGPTGAGKTTVLDAICLALYGRTPRLTRVTKSVNEIMSRQTGECFAETTFETQVGRFRCHWSQHRARKRPDGDLQAPKHEIANADSGEIFESKVKGVAEQIEAATGMDFERFTRSMLLAQGGFAAFLQAAPDDRSPILEQITGTEIYSRISVRVHERRLEERKRLDKLQAELAGIALLSAEEVREFTEQRQRLSQQDAELGAQLGHYVQAVQWLEGISRLERELDEIGRAKSAAFDKIAAFAPERERLRLANQALELAADYTGLLSSREAQIADQTALDDYRTALPEHLHAAAQAEQTLNHAALQLTQSKTEQQTWLPVIKKAQELDLRIIEKAAPIKAAQLAVTEQAKALAAGRLKQNTAIESLAQQRQSLQQLKAHLAARQSDEKLVEQLANLQSRFAILKNLAGQMTDKITEKTAAQQQLEAALTVWRQQTVALETETDQCAKNQSRFTEKQAELLQLLGSQELADWRKRQVALNNRRDAIGKILAAVETLTKSNQSYNTLEQRQTLLAQEEIDLNSAIEFATERHTALEKELGLLETQLNLLQRIQQLEEMRGQLQDGEPCPLCGASDHPFASGNIPVPDQTRQMLAGVKTDLKVFNNRISEQKVRLAQVNKDLEQTAANLTEQLQRIQEARQAIIEYGTPLALAWKLTTDDPELLEKFLQLQTQVLQELKSVNGILESAETLEKELSSLRTALDTAKDGVIEREREVRATAYRKESGEQTLARLTLEAVQIQQQHQDFLQALQTEMAVYGITGIAMENIDTIYQQLAERRAAWLAGKQQEIELTRQIAALEAQHQQHAEQLNQAQIEHQKQQDLLNALLEELELLKTERRAVFGDKLTAETEQHLGAAIAAAEASLDEARQKSTAVTQALDQLKIKIADLTKAIELRQLQITAMQDAFSGRLTSSGFTHEAHYRSCCMNETERSRLAAQAQALTDEYNTWVSKEQDKRQLLEAEQQKKITAEPLEQLETAKAALVVTQRELQLERGGIERKLKDNEELKQQQQQRLQALAAQQREYQRWEQLHTLIGSADGKRYRNFAQGLTFEIMVGHANRQLQKMTDRYLLVHDELQPLEINVIDNYQAGEVRSTKNLSGGESFIVSLALALGLSHMASKNVRVDSLFLDEGFGTLDEEALDTALETLSSLQQDGKLIGVISHVPALKERIGTQIQIVPQTGGRSRISGPGCTQGASLSSSN